MTSAAARRLRLAALLIATVAFGIVSRRVHVGFVLWDKTAGDVLYAVAVYTTLAMVAVRASAVAVALAAFLVCFAIELFQLTGIPIDLARTYPWVHWLLGAAFAWQDVASYAAGAAMVAGVERIWRRRISSAS